MADAPRPSPLAPLVKALGWRRTLAVGLDVALRRGGRPFAHLPPPADRRERESRAQAEPAVLLYRALLRRLPADRALAVVGDVIDAGAQRHLARLLHDLDPPGLARLAPAEARRLVEDQVGRFFNATTRVDAVGADRVSFTVTACAFVRLCREAGHPELAPAFCRGDGAFLASRGVTLDRPTTLAEGGPACPFHLRMGP